MFGKLTLTIQETETAMLNAIEVIAQSRREEISDEEVK